MSTKNDLWVGLDIGTQSVKLVAFEKKRTRWILKDFRVQTFPLGEEGEPSRYEDWLAENLRSLVAQIGLGGCRVSNTLSGTQVALRKLVFPAMPLEEIKEAARWQGKTAFPFPLDEAILDAYSLGPIKKNEEAKQEVLVAAAQRNLINQRLALLQASNLRPSCLTLIPMGLKRSYLLSSSRVTEESVALLDIGAQTTTIAMVQKDELVFSREVGLGGMDFTQAVIDLSRDLKPGFPLEVPDAEKIKFQHGVQVMRFPHPRKRSTIKASPSAALHRSMSPVLERLLLEIDRSFSYFKTQVEEASIDRIFLSGGGSLLKGLPEAIRKTFNLPVEQYNLLNTLEVDTGVDRKLLEASIPFLTIAIGVAVEERPLLNLLPLEKKGRFPILGENQKKILAFGALGLLFFGYLGQQYFSASSELRKLEKKVALRQQEINRMEVSKKDLENLKWRQDQLDQQLTAYPPTMIERMPAQEVLLEIGHRLSPNMTLTSFSLISAPEPVAEKGGEQKAPASPNSVQPGKPGLGLKIKAKQERQLLLKGIVFGPGDQILKALDDFSRGLEQVSYITQVRLEEIKKNELFGALSAQDFQMIIRLNL